MTSPFNPRDVEVLAAALPGTADNPLGRATRGVLTTHLKRCTPGHYSQMFGTGPAFRDIFFRGVQPNPHESAIVTLTGLDDAFFASTAVAALCQQMGQSTSRLRPQILMGDIAGDLNGWNTRLMTGSYRFYAYMAAVADGVIRTALAAFPDPAAKLTAKQHYLAGLTSEAWVTAKKLQEASQQWPDRDWELFHHWIKLTALGADAGEIDRAIQTIIDMGLRIPAGYGPARWREQSPWFGPGLGAGDVSDAVGPILETKCQVYPGGGYSCMAEDNSFEFTANSQPGNRYRRLPSSSCFIPGTRVVTADGRLRPIESITPGELVATPEGPKQVLLRAETRRDGRTLQRFAGSRFAFSATHPFVAAPAPGRGYYAAADPAGLARAVPMLAPFGISPLDAGGVELVRYTPEGGTPWPVLGVQPDPDSRSDLLYDLVVDLGEDGRSEYFAGDERTQVLVSSEIPRFGAAPDAAWVLMRILEQVAPVILDVLAPVPDESFADLVNVGLTSLARTLMPAVGPDLHGDPEQCAQTAAGPVAPREAARALAGALARPEGGTDRRATIVYEQFVAVFAPQIQAALAMGWRSFDLASEDVANLLAVDLYDIELFRQGGPDTPMTVDLAIALGAVSYTRHIPVVGRETDQYLTIDGPAYFPEWSRPQAEATSWSGPDPSAMAPAPAMPPVPWPPTPPERLLWEMRIRLAPWSTATASLPLPAGIAHGYEDFTAPLLDPGGNVVGSAHGDIRILTSEAFAAEWEGRQAWQPADQDRLAHRLADLGGRYIADGFAKAVDEFRFCAATTRTP